MDSQAGCGQHRGVALVVAVARGRLHKDLPCQAEAQTSTENISGLYKSQNMYPAAVKRS